MGKFTFILLAGLLWATLLRAEGSSSAPTVRPNRADCEVGLGAVLYEEAPTHRRIAPIDYEPSRHTVPVFHGDEPLTPAEALGRIQVGLEEAGYKDLQAVNQGGMGAIIRGKDKEGNEVIIKTALYLDPNAISLLRAERDFTKELSDLEKNEPVKYFLEVPDGAPQNIKGPSGELVPVIITKAVPFKKGESELAKSLKSFDPVIFDAKPAMVAEIQTQLAAALNRLHNSPKGLIHRDLKPENILISLDEQGHVHLKLIDLGLSAATQGVAENRRGFPFMSGAQGLMTGTPGYVSPRQMRGQPATPADDVYNLRRINWLLRSHRLPPGDWGLVERFFSPARPRDPFGSGSSGSSNKAVGEFYEPKVALDHTDHTGKVLPLRDRMIAMAEFSNWPMTVDEYEDLRHRAETMDPSQFFVWYLPKVLSLDSASSLARTPQPIRYNAARELLNGTILTEKISTQLASTMSRSELEALVRGYYFLKSESNNALIDPSTLGPLGSHPYLNYSTFLQTINSLHARGLIKDPETLRDEALEARDLGIRYW